MGGRKAIWAFSSFELKYINYTFNFPKERIFKFLVSVQYRCYTSNLVKVGPASSSWDVNGGYAD